MIFHVQLLWDIDNFGASYVGIASATRIGRVPGGPIPRDGAQSPRQRLGPRAVKRVHPTDASTPQ